MPGHLGSLPIAVTAPLSYLEQLQECPRSSLALTVSCGCLQCHCLPVILLWMGQSKCLSKKSSQVLKRVNAVAKFDAYPMLRVDELVENIGQARYISTLDLTKGYWQVPVAPEDQEKTAFTTP
ncbi:hypothetical protein Y1Q_0009184 [Alligator mississippiensis]|uniref:ribonuclease H n=1 Tax=Alligator mississippiensis TaxID=8496 RepID=A0A151M2K9_ALLMI|nr:hypothetical protein Y1Q_0009184 [Alligator mississippiensis]